MKFRDQPRLPPAQRAAALCQARGGDFRDELEAHLLGGFVFSTPESFLMGRPVRRGAAEIADPWAHWPRPECDAWFVWVGVGRAAALLAQMPYPLPWIGWHRQGRAWRADHWTPLRLLSQRLAPQFASALLIH